MRKMYAGLLIVTLLLTGCAGSHEIEMSPEPPVRESKVVETTETVVETTEAAVLVDLSFLDGSGYTDEQITGMQELLMNVGITEVADPEVGKVNNGLQTIKGVAYKAKGERDEVVVRITIQDGVIFYVNIYCPAYYNEYQSDCLDGLTDRRAELYYDVEGGYLKKIDWENMIVVDYEEGA